MIRVKYYRPNADVYDLRYFKDDNELEEWIKTNALPPYNESIKIIDKHYFKLKEPVDG